MKIFFSTFYLLIFSISLMAQEGWFYQNPLPQNNTLYDLAITGSDIVYAVGAGGIIIKSTDLGESWDIQYSNPEKYLISVFFLTPDIGWTVGDQGLILHTEDGGLNWDLQESNVTKDLKGVFFLNDTVGFICGTFIVLKTIDGGIHWYVIPELSNYDNLFVTITFINGNTGWLSGGGRKIFKTTNSGQSWELIYQGNNGSFNSLFFTDELNGWAAGYLYIGKTTDGGYNWEYPVYWSGGDFRKILFVDSTNGFALTDRRLYKTSDGGNTWTDYLNINFNANNISFIEDTGISVGSNGLIKKTTDGGTNWQIKSQNYLGYYVLDVIFLNDNLGWCLAGGVVFNSLDGGASWQEQQTPAYNSLSSIDFINENDGWVAGNEKVIRTTTGGSEWIDSYYLQDHNFNCVKFYDENFGVVAGDSGKVLSSFDGGNTWLIYTVTDSICFYDIYFVTRNVIWLAGNKGLAYKSTDGGFTWTGYAVRDNSTILTGVVFKDMDYGWISFMNGLLSTQDGGLTWQTVNLPLSFDTYAKIYRHNNKLWLIGSSGNILVSSDDGINWVHQKNNTKSILTAICFVDDNTGWISGLGSLILKTTNGGTTFIESGRDVYSSPENYLLSQNYPNPFNPATKIKYHLPELSRVRLTVYDILGREISTLINEEKPAGSYEAEFDGTGLPSGVYFYRIETAKYSDTKKLLLLK